jgi:hypothetical protein
MSSCRLTTLLVFLFCVTPLCAQDRSEGSKAKGKRPTGQTLSAEILIDHDYSFEILREKESYRLLDQKAAQELAVDAVAGMQLSLKCFGVVIVEPTGDSFDLDEYASLLLENMQLENFRIESQSELKVRGLPAKDTEFSGSFNGLSVRYRSRVLLRGGFGFHILGWTLGSGKTPLLKEFADAFSLRSDAPKLRSIDWITPDATGVGWRLRKGEFVSAPDRLRVVAPRGWFLLVGENLASTNPEASVGLQHRAASAYLNVVSERVPLEAREALSEFYRSTFRENLGVGKAKAKTMVRVGGREVEGQIYQTADQSLVFVHLVIFEGDRAHQITAWTLGVGTKKKLALLREGIEAIQFIDGPTSTSLREELTELPDAQCFLENDLSVRNGTFRDFASGLVFVKPESRYWSIVTGQAARQENPDLIFYAEELELGLQTSVIVEDFEGTLEDYLEAVKSNFRDDPGFRFEGKTRSEKLAGHAGCRFSGRSKSDGVPLSFEVALTVGDGMALQVITAIYEGLLESEEATAALKAFHKGLALSKANRRRTVENKSSYQDFRLGYAVNLEGLSKGGANLFTAPMDSVMAGYRISGPKSHSAIYMGVVQPGGGQNAEAVRSSMLRAMEGRLPAKLKDSKPKDRKGKISGTAYVGRVWQSADARAEARVLNIGRRFFSVVVFGDAIWAARCFSRFKILE